MPPHDNISLFYARFKLSDPKHIKSGLFGMQICFFILKIEILHEISVSKYRNETLYLSLDDEISQILSYYTPIAKGRITIENQISVLFSHFSVIFSHSVI